MADTNIKNNRCDSCSAPIIWAFTERGKKIPLDPDPDPKGNMVLDNNADDGTVIAVYAKEEDSRARYVSHFATCPDAGMWRKK